MSDKYKPLSFSSSAKSDIAMNSIFHNDALGDGKFICKHVMLMFSEYVRNESRNVLRSGSLLKLLFDENSLDLSLCMHGNYETTCSFPAAASTTRCKNALR